jgi:hypothetical protein
MNCHSERSEEPAFVTSSESSDLTEQGVSVRSLLDTDGNMIKGLAPGEEGGAYRAG